MCKDPIYYEAYLAGYRDGVKDVASGKAAAWKSTDIGNSPIRAMAISTRAYNCLANYGCTYVEDSLWGSTF